MDIVLRCSIKALVLEIVDASNYGAHRTNMADIAARAFAISKTAIELIRCPIDRANQQFC